MYLFFLIWTNKQAVLSQYEIAESLQRNFQ